jgi:hypothetical protein
MMDLCNKKIRQERERSRENFKRHVKTKDRANLSDDSINNETTLMQSTEPNNAIRGVPEFIARLQKSPLSR